MRGGARVCADAFDTRPNTSVKSEGAGCQFRFFRFGQLGSRRFNALKIWMALKNLGVGGYAKSSSAKLN